MTNAEVVNELRSRLKPYIGIVKPSFFSQMCRKIENGMCKPKTVEKFFYLFGYIGSWDNYKISENLTLVLNKKE